MPKILLKASFRYRSAAKIREMCGSHTGKLIGSSRSYCRLRAVEIINRGAYGGLLHLGSVEYGKRRIEYGGKARGGITEQAFQLITMRRL